VKVHVPTLVNPAAEAESTSMIADAGALVSRAESLVVTDDESMANANAVLVAISAARKALDTKRDGFKRPALEFGRMIDGFFRPLIDRCDEAKRALGGRVAALITRREEEAKRQREAAEREAAKKAAEAEAARQAAENAEDDDPVAALAVDAAETAASLAAAKAELTPHVPTVNRVEGGGTVSVRKRWTFEVTDEAAVPRHFFTLDEKKIAAAVRAGERSIPGVRVFRVAGAAVR